MSEELRECPECSGPVILRFRYCPACGVLLPDAKRPITRPPVDSVGVECAVRDVVEAMDRIAGNLEQGLMPSIDFATIRAWEHILLAALTRRERGVDPVGVDAECSFTGMLRALIEVRLGKPASRVMQKEIVYMMARSPEKVSAFMDGLGPVRAALTAPGDTCEGCDHQGAYWTTGGWHCPSCGTKWKPNYTPTTEGE